MLDLCVNCGIPVVQAPPKDCSNHCTARASLAFRAKREAPQVRAEKTAINTWSADELPARDILMAIETIFGVSAQVLSLKKHINFETKFARYLALYIADQYDDAGHRMQVIGKKLGITSAAAQRNAVLHVGYRIHADSPCGTKAQRVINALGITINSPA